MVVPCSASGNSAKALTFLEKVSLVINSALRCAPIAIQFRSAIADTLECNSPAFLVYSLLELLGIPLNSSMEFGLPRRACSAMVHTPATAVSHPLISSMNWMASTRRAPLFAAARIFYRNCYSFCMNWSSTAFLIARCEPACSSPTTSSTMSSSERAFPLQSHSRVVSSPSGDSFAYPRRSSHVGYSSAQGCLFHWMDTAMFSSSTRNVASVWVTL